MSLLRFCTFQKQYYSPFKKPIVYDGKEGSHYTGPVPPCHASHVCILVVWSKVAAGLCFCCSFLLGIPPGSSCGFVFCSQIKFCSSLVLSWNIIFMLYKHLAKDWPVSVWQVMRFVIFNRN